MGYFPFQNTGISPNQSASHIVELLESLGFDTVGQLSRQSQKIVVATYRGAEFRFVANADEIFNAMVKEKPRTDRQWIRDQSSRIAWRLLWNQVKNSCDVLRYKAADIAQVFGGFLVINQPDGKQIGLAQLIIDEVEAGRMLSSKLGDQFLIEDKR